MNSGDPQALLAEIYGSNADGYARLWAPALRALSRLLIERLPLAGARRVLDVGTGIGTLLGDLRDAAPAASVVGIDISEGMVRLAKPPVAVGDAMRLPARDGAADVVVMAFMLFHVPDPAAALREVARALRPGGAAGIATWGPDTAYPAIEIWTEELDAHGADPLSELAAVRRHELVDSEEKMRALAGEAGLRDVQTWTGQMHEVYTLDAFIAERTSMGVSRRRLASLSEEAQCACIERARVRIGRRGDDVLTERAQVVYTTGRR